MIKFKLKNNAQKIDNFLKNFLNKQKKLFAVNTNEVWCNFGGKKNKIYDNL